MNDEVGLINYSNVRIGGDIFINFDRFTDFELNRVSEIEEQLNNVIKSNFKPKFFNCDNDNGYPIITNKIENKDWCFPCFPRYCFEFIPNITFVYAYMLSEEKELINKIFIDSVIEVFNEEIKEKLNGKFGYYIIFENNKDELPYFKLNFYLSAFAMSKKELFIIDFDYDEYRDDNFFKVLHALWIAKVRHKWNSLIKNYPVEAYDEYNESVTNKYQNIKGWRIAFDNDSIEKIKNKYNAYDCLDGECNLIEFNLFK